MIGIRNPKFGNQFSVKSGILIHDLMDSDVQIFLPSDRPALEGFVVQFEALTTAEVDSLIDFFTESAAEEIQLTDHEGTIWTGLVMSPTIVFTEGKGSCKWETSFQFEGVRS